MIASGRGCLTEPPPPFAAPVLQNHKKKTGSASIGAVRHGQLSLEGCGVPADDNADSIDIGPLPAAGSTYGE